MSENGKRGNIIFKIIICVLLAAMAAGEIKLWLDLQKLKNENGTQISVNQQLTKMLENMQNSDSVSYRGSWTDIPQEVLDQIEGNTLMEDSPVEADELAYLTIPYYNFDGQIAEGHMIAARKLADEILDIFEELCINQYPIESIDIAENFNQNKNAVLDSLEAASMGSNNTTSLMYRKRSDGFDKAAYGQAIDLNPKLNPEVTEDGTMPRNALDYKDRDTSKLNSTEKWAFISEESDVVKIFEKYGWTWRGADGYYGRFEK